VAWTAPLDRLSVTVFVSCNHDEFVEEAIAAAGSTFGGALETDRHVTSRRGSRSGPIAGRQRSVLRRRPSIIEKSGTARVASIHSLITTSGEMHSGSTLKITPGSSESTTPPGVQSQILIS
jgi:hypothetical protein